MSGFQGMAFLAPKNPAREEVYHGELGESRGESKLFKKTKLQEKNLEQG